ncbi:hypothetical protein [Inquilinus limosus]|uniref:hypothetical protein n=1 Tax=Inquilinus limosus TaxID=171674 RepID=UPI0011982837|nr:hypothetical protein [Inquilinus limosus]
MADSYTAVLWDTLSTEYTIVSIDPPLSRVTTLMEGNSIGTKELKPDAPVEIKKISDQDKITTKYSFAQMDGGCMIRVDWIVIVPILGKFEGSKDLPFPPY